MLIVEDLSIGFKNAGRVIQVTEGVSFEVHQSECIGLVGESGCGKSISVLALMGLLNSKTTMVKAKRLEFNGINLLTLSDSDWLKIRGREISIIFQNPMTSLNPTMTCGNQVAESLLWHGVGKKGNVKGEVCQLFERLGIHDPDRIYHNFPWELSGGLRQRVMIAIALACKPKLLIADEPTTALDVTVQAQILELLKNLQKEEQLSLILISHDLGVVKQLVSKMVVMYAGQIVEKGAVEEICANPFHPYTVGLLKAVPSLRNGAKKVQGIPGTVPTPENFLSGCHFRDRCFMAKPECMDLTYQLVRRGNDESLHETACPFYV